MLRLIGIGTCVLMCSLILKNRSRVFYEIIIIAGCVMILGITLSGVVEISSTINKISELVNDSVPYVRLMMKVLGITIITQVLADTCRDNGEGALAGIIETSAKIIAIALVLPLFETIITIVSGLVK